MPTKRENTCASAASRCHGYNEHRTAESLNGPRSHPHPWRPALVGRDSHRRRQERRPAADGCRAADRPARGADQRAEAGRHRHHVAAAGAARHRRGAHRQRWAHAVARGRDHQHRGALRHRAQDARVVPGAGAAGRPRRRGARVVAGRLQHRRSPDRPAFEGPGAARRTDPAGGRLHPSPRPRPPARRHHPVPLRFGGCDGKPADGGGAGGRPHRARQRRARAGDRRPRRLPGEDGRAHRRASVPTS